MPVRTCSLIATTIYPNHSAGNRSGLRRGEASVYTSPCSGGTARFRRLLCPLLTSATGSPPLTVRSVRLWTTRQISRGEHAFLRTRAPSIPIWPIMDRGLCLVLQARPTKPACRRSRLRGLGSCSSPRALAVPCRSRAASFPGTAAEDTRLLYRYTVAARYAHSRIRLAFPLRSNSPPSGWVWDLMSVETKGKLTAPFRIRAAPGTQQPAAQRTARTSRLVSHGVMIIIRSSVIPTVYHRDSENLDT